LDSLHINCYHSNHDLEFSIHDDSCCYFSDTVVANFLTFTSKILSHSIQFELPSIALDTALAKYGSSRSSSTELHSLKFYYDFKSTIGYPTT
jgi:hypothetical protein